jgi:hypothetical protein
MNIRMPTKSYYIDHEQTRVLSVHLTPGWRTTTVFLDGKELFAFETKEKLKKGATIRIDDDNTLFISLRQTIFEGGFLEIMLNGVPVKGSPADPDKRATSRFLLVMGSGFLTLLMSLYLELFTLWGAMLFPVMQISALIGGTVIIGLSFAFRYLNLFGLILGYIVMTGNIAQSMMFATQLPGITTLVVLIVKIVILAWALTAIPLAREKQMNARRSPWLVLRERKTGKLKTFDREGHDSYIP